MQFAIGQRWISGNENELGLGIVTEITARTVNLHFPAAEETRTYAIVSAPLTRVLFHAGDTVRHADGRHMRLVETAEENNIMRYRARCADSGREIWLWESELAPYVSFNRPQERLFNYLLDRTDRFALRYRTLQHRQAQFQSPWRGLRGMRAGLIPHQLHIAREVGRRIHPRVLLADEVGLGKTIEAGMIIQQQLLAEKVERVLIIVPENLQHQWLVEMLRRFNLPFSLFDEERAADLAVTGEEAEHNPFDSENLILCALDWLVGRPKRAEQLLNSRFDLLVADEAHHLVWSETMPSPQYRLIEQLAHRIPAVLLLTATPEQLGQESHFARLRLLDPDRFYDYRTFIAEQAGFRPIADTVQSLLSGKALTEEEQRRLTAVFAEQSVVHLLRAVNGLDTERRNSAVQELIRRLIDRHGTGRLLFRNTRQNVRGFPQRIYHPIVLDTTEQTDPRFDWLLKWLRGLRHEKVLVMCRLATTAVRLERRLREKAGLRAALFHEQMSIIERDRAVAYFADPAGAQVLLTSAIGSEGRNFQFVARLVLFDLPDHPDLLEQCIGRLDRIGQTRAVQIYVPCIRNAPSHRLSRWYHEGLNAFEQTCPTGAFLLEKCGRNLQRFLTQPEESAAFDAFLDDVRRQRHLLREALELGRDRLLELNSYGGTEAERLAADIATEEENTELKDFALRLFDIIGAEQEELGERSFVVTPTGTMLVADFPGLKPEGITVTFDRTYALAREDVEFLTWDHPMIRNGIDLILTENLGKAAVALLINPKLPPGTLLLEQIYVVESQTPKGLHLTRFLPPTPIRLLSDSRGHNLAEQVSFVALEKQLKPLDNAAAVKIIKTVRPHIERMLRLSEQHIHRQARQIVAQAKRQAEIDLSAELERLTALQTVNPNIRDDEIAVLARLRTQSLAELDKAAWRPDSLRLIVSNQP